MQSGAETTGNATPTAAAACDRWLAATMFWLGLAFLILASGVLHRIGQESSSEFEFHFISLALLILWPLFLVEGLISLRVAVRPDRLPWRLLVVALIVLAPPLRMGCRGYVDAAKMWLPVWGWCMVDRHLRKRLERFFSVPMMAIAFLVLPVLALEHFWAEQVRAHFVALLFLNIASSVIWMAFAAEFILMMSVADMKLRYCLSNWMDLVIVVLPIVEFLPILRLFRLTRLLSLQQLTRLYRLRGLMYKLWRAILLLDVLYRLIGDKKEKRLLRLKEALATKLNEVDDLKKEIEVLEHDLAKCKAATEAVTEPAAPAAVAMPAATPAELPAAATCQVSETANGM